MEPLIWSHVYNFQDIDEPFFFLACYRVSQSAHKETKQSVDTELI